MVTKENVTKNVLWRLAERIGAQGVSFIVSIVLARLITPDEYGAVSLVTVVIFLLDVFVDSGLGSALIQKKDADDLDFSTVFYFNIVFCIILYLILYVSAPMIAVYFGVPEITSIARVLGIYLIFSGIKNIQQAYVSRNMMFRKFFYATLGGTLISAVVGIAMALKGYGVWALVGQYLTNAFFDTLILWITVKWRPIAQVSFERFVRLFSYGWKLLASALIETLYNNMFTIVIGIVHTTADLAYFNKGMQFPSIIITNLDTAIGSVLFPSMASVQDRIESLRNMLRKSIKTTSFLVWPMMIGLAVVAPSLVHLLLTDKWACIIPYIRLFCLAYVFYPMQTANMNAINAVGRSDIYMIQQIINKSIGVIALVSTLWIGPVAVAAGVAVTAPITVAVNAFPNKKILNYGITDQIRDIMFPVLSSLFMGLVILPVRYLPLPEILVLFMQIITGVLVYYLIAKITKNDSLIMLESMIRKRGQL